MVDFLSVIEVDFTTVISVVGALCAVIVWQAKGNEKKERLIREADQDKINRVMAATKKAEENLIMAFANEDYRKDMLSKMDECIEIVKEIKNRNYT